MSAAMGPRTTDRYSVVAWGAVVGLVTAGISLGRLWLGNSQAITQTLWAEDGLFPLCIHKADFWTCTTQPFAGYLLFAPRALAWPTSVLPWEHWALAANLIAAVLAGVTALFVVTIARGAGVGWFVTVALALLPVVAPMAGLEALNSVGSSYMLLLYAGTLALVLSPQRGRVWTVLVGLWLLITALTIPTAVVLIGILLVQILCKAVRWPAAVVWLGSLALGLVGQAVAALTAPTPRPVQLTGESWNSWANAVPTSILTYWPGLSLGEYSFFTNFSLAPLAFTGWLFVALIAVVGVWRLGRGWGSLGTFDAAVGMLLIAGLLFGLIPSAIGFANNRYFVVPLLLWGAAVLVWLEPAFRRLSAWATGLLVVLVFIVWLPAMPTSEFRSTPAPPWQEEVARVEARCQSDLALMERPIFSPFWPPNWGDGLDEPTHPNVPCTTVFRWLP